MSCTVGDQEGDVQKIARAARLAVFPRSMRSAWKKELQNEKYDQTEGNRHQ